MKRTKKKVGYWLNKNDAICLDCVSGSERPTDAIYTNGLLSGTLRCDSCQSYLDKGFEDSDTLTCGTKLFIRYKGAEKVVHIIEVHPDDTDFPYLVECRENPYYCMWINRAQILKRFPRMPNTNYSVKELKLILACAEYSKEALNSVAAAKLEKHELSAMVEILTAEDIAKLITKTKQLLSSP